MGKTKRQQWSKSKAKSKQYFSKEAIMRKILTISGFWLFLLLVALPLVALSSQATPERFTLDIRSMRFGGSGYVGSFVLTNLINKKSTWLRAACIETGGTIDNLKTLTVQPEKRKKSLIYGTYETTYPAALGISPFEAKYTTAKAIALLQTPFSFFFTIDPNIKSGRDLVGKRIGCSSRGASSTYWIELLLKEVWNIRKDVKLEFLGRGGNHKAVADGKVAVSVASPILIGDKLLSNPGIEEFIATRGADFHCVSISLEDMRILREKTGYPLYGTKVKAGALSPNQSEPIEGALSYNGWMADVELPDDVVYEVCRIIYENYKEFWGHHASLKGLCPEKMPTMAATEKDFHPGAVKFYKEKGLEIGIKK
jgi:TRAP transporter TAXI family solute receptor